MEIVECSKCRRDLVKDERYRYPGKLYGEKSGYYCEEHIQFFYASKIRNIASRAVIGFGERAIEVRKFLGCDSKTFKAYIEDQFQEGMNWGNRSFYGWHLDHIKPLSEFDLKYEEEQIKACHYTNLRPLWQYDNFKRITRAVKKKKPDYLVIKGDPIPLGRVATMLKNSKDLGLSHTVLNQAIDAGVKMERENLIKYLSEMDEVWNDPAKTKEDCIKDIETLKRSLISIWY